MSTVLAARLGDNVGCHTGALSGLLKGLIAGAAIGIAVALTISTAGLAGPVLFGAYVAATAGTIGLMGTLGRAEMEKGRREQSGSPCSEVKRLRRTCSSRPGTSRGRTIRPTTAAPT